VETSVVWIGTGYTRHSQLIEKRLFGSFSVTLLLCFLLPKVYEEMDETSFYSVFEIFKYYNSFLHLTMILLHCPVSHNLTRTNSVGSQSS